MTQNRRRRTRTIRNSRLPETMLSFFFFNVPLNFGSSRETDCCRLDQSVVDILIFETPRSPGNFRGPLLLSSSVSMLQP